MAFTLPSFNILCNIRPTIATAWPPINIPPGPDRISGQACALVAGRRVAAATLTLDGASHYPPVLPMFLLLPALVDIRGMQDTTTKSDAVECPAGSGRWYVVSYVDDVAKGYANEHRMALMFAIQSRWVAPYP